MKSSKKTLGSKTFEGTETKGGAFASETLVRDVVELCGRVLTKCVVFRGIATFSLKDQQKLLIS